MPTAGGTYHATIMCQACGDHVTVYMQGSILAREGVAERLRTVYVDLHKLLDKKDGKVQLRITQPRSQVLSRSDQAR